VLVESAQFNGLSSRQAFDAIADCRLLEKQHKGPAPA
jgi:hypothetical protein